MVAPEELAALRYQEANRTFWRQTVIPLAQRTAHALSNWLGAAYGGGLILKPDLDAIEALGPEREALWSRLRDAPFLTINEKRAAVGYGPVDGGDECPRQEHVCPFSSRV